MDKHRDLVEHLIQKTEGDAIKWQESPRQGAFHVSFSQYTLMLYYDYNHEVEENDYIIEIMNGNGTVIDRFTDVEITKEGNNYFKKMQSLYESARRKALGADKALDDILLSLEEKGSLF